MDMAIAR
jgi:putative transposase